MFLLEHFQEGGWGMWPILVLFALTVWFTLERFMYLTKSKTDVDKLIRLSESDAKRGGR